MFSVNAAYMGSRLGICWEILAEKHEEFRRPHVRDPYPLIAEKAGLEKGVMLSKLLRTIATGKYIDIYLSRYLFYSQYIRITCFHPSIVENWLYL